MHVPTRDWPEQDAFLRYIDQLKKRHNIRHDSALAELAGISHTAISNWRNGKAKPSSLALKRIATATDEPTQPLLAVAGLIEGQEDDADPLADVPAVMRRLITIYRSADPGIREQIEGGVEFLVEGAEARVALAQMKNQQRRTS